MLAYLFHHWRRATVDQRDYEERLVRFHRALHDSPPAGFFHSYSMGHAGTPWANAGGDAYEDWYVLDGSAGLDPLNDAAITASRQLPHDEAAAAAAGGTAGLYRARIGVPAEPPRYEYWFGKPAGLSYPDLYSALRPFAGNGAGVLWVRQMTLGPAREFCLQAARACELPSGFDAIELHPRVVWPTRP